MSETPYLILDARYEKVRMDGKVLICAVLTAIGILPSGKRSVLGASAKLSEAEVHWRDFLARSFALTPRQRRADGNQ